MTAMLSKPISTYVSALHPSSLQWHIVDFPYNADNTPASAACTVSTPSKRARSWSDDDDDHDEEPDSDGQADKRPKILGAVSGRPHHSRGRRLRLPRTGDIFLDFYKRPRTAFVDKTLCIRQLPAKFQCLLLRPPRFGKTTLISTMIQYYDVHEAKLFHRRFGSLAAVTQPTNTTPLHNQHLCMFFELADVDIHCDVNEFASGLSVQISSWLCMFLREYSEELQVSDPSEFFRQDITFAQVFDLVRASGYTLFVGVDDYDIPTRMRSFAHLDYPASMHENFVSTRDIEHLLDTHFWRPLLAEPDVIDKLLVTGTLPVKYPTLDDLHVLGIDGAPSLQASCGFSEQEALAFIQSISDETPDIVELRRSCGGYVFPSPNPVEPVLHPQQIMARISKAPLQYWVAAESSLRLLSGIFDLLPETSYISSVVTLNALIDLLAAGAVEMDAASLVHGFDSTAVTWNILYHAGALTSDGHTFRVANGVALAMIHARVDTLFADWHDLQHTYLTAWSDYSMGGRPKSFLALLSQILCDLGQASFGKKHEPTMAGVLELVMRNTHASPYELMDPIILLPPGTTRFTIPGYQKDTFHVWDLNTLTLLGMWQATNLDGDAPTVEALQELHEELLEDDEESLLARPYRVWSPTLNAMETRLVGSFFDTQSEIHQFLAVGGARVLLHPRPIGLPKLYVRLGDSTYVPLEDSLYFGLMITSFDPEPEYPQSLAVGVGGAQVLLRQPPIIPAASDPDL